MESIETNWKIGEIVNIQRSDRMLKNGRMETYKQFVSSRYVCIREASNEKRGILVKVLGKMPASFINIVEGMPFVKDDTEHLFYNSNYYSFPFPKAAEVEEVLSIIRNNQELLKQFESISMHVNPESTFWIRETTRNRLLIKQAQYFDARSSHTYTASKDDIHYRLSVVYYYNSELIW